MKYDSIKSEPDMQGTLIRIRVLCKQRRTCIQAGGLFGEWPIELAKLFDTVQTFEPEPNNYEILLANVEGINNISAYPYALGMVRGRVDMCRSNDEDRNPGAWYTQFGNEIKQIAIDSFSVDDVDLIYLDIEGGETDALLGATETIKRCRPIIGLENKKNEFWRRFGYTRSPVEMLERDFGYVRVSRLGLDVLLMPKENQ